MVRKRRTQHRRRNQKGGGDGYFAINTQAPIPTASGAPLDSRVPISFCGWDNGRVAPTIDPTMMSQFGGRRRRLKTRKQRGGCDGGCSVSHAPIMQQGGGSGTGGYGLVLDNTLGKVYHTLSVGACPPPPVANPISGFSQMGGRRKQKGGNAASDYGIVVYNSGYGYNNTSPVTTSSAHYLNQIPYDKCGQTGGTRKRKHKRRHQ